MTRSLRAVVVDRRDLALAVVAWLAGLPLAVLLVRGVDENPFTIGGVVMPIGIGGVVGGALVALAVRRITPALVGVAVGLYAAWTGMTMAAGLNGTPFGYGQMLGDQGRLVAQATKSMTTWGAVDGFVHNLPSEYPPLYPWAVGHVAQLLHRPAWKVFGDAQIVLMSISIVLAYLLWRRFAGPVTSFVIVALAPAVYAEPSKAYEFVVLMIILPWAIATFTGLPREQGGMHWLPAGVIGGLIVLTYSGFLVFSALGIIALMVITLRPAGRRLPYLLNIAGVVGTAFVVASWYVVPFVVRLATHGGNRISDMFLAPELVATPLPLPFLEPTPVGLVELVGLFGVIWYRRTAAWALPLLLISVSTYAYRIVFLLQTTHNDHTGYSQYTDRLTAMALAAAGVLTAARAAPVLAARVPVAVARRPRELVAAGIIALVAWAGVQGWEQWMPGPRGIANVNVGPAGEANLATSAHLEPLPDGRQPRYTPSKLPATPYFPALAVRRAIDATNSTNTHPIVLCFDQRLFGYYPYYAFSPPKRLSTNTLTRWDDRAAVLRQLASLVDPATFARQSLHTKFGRIDDFVLQASGGAWTWSGIAFSRQVFDPAYFHVTRLPGGVVVAVRNP